MTAYQQRGGIRGVFRTLALLSCLGACVGIVAASPTAKSVPGTPVGIEVTENSTDRIVLQYTFGDFQGTPVEIAGEVLSTLKLPGEPQLRELGEPELPLVCRSLAIPNDVRPIARVISEDYYEIPADIVPSKGPLPRSVNPADVPYEFGKVYETDAFYPGFITETGSPYVMRDVRGVTVRVYPHQFNPVTRTLRVYTNLTVAVDLLPSNDEAETNAQPKDNLSRAFVDIYGDHFINYAPPVRYTPLDEDGDMLIICHDAWLPNIQPLVDHKNSIGINTTAVGVSTIGNSVSNIQAYIQNIYDTSDLAFVLLVGDVAQVTTPTTVSGYNGASDPVYAKLAGSDDYPEILIGRFSAETAADVDTQVERTIEYENMPATQQDWFWRGTGIASDEGTGDDGQWDFEHMDEIRGWLMSHGYTTIDQIYDPGANPSHVSTAVNAGRGIINYVGHGSITSWGSSDFSNSHVNNLTNDNMLPFIISVACNNGEFDGYTTCFGEAWLRATNGGEPTGAIGAYMGSLTQPWSPPMEGQDEFNIRYTAETYHSYGALCFAGSCSMMDDYPGSGNTWGTGPATFNTWILFGDPSLRIIGTVEPPTGLRVTPDTPEFYSEGSTGGPFNPPSMDFTLENVGDEAFDYEVTVTQPWLTVINGTGTLPGESTTIVTIQINAVAEGFDNGLYTDLITFTNLYDNIGDTTRDVRLKVGIPLPIHVFDLDTDPGWSREGEWEFGNPAGLGGRDHGYPDPADGATGANVFGVNLDGDYSTAIGGPYYLTMGPVDLTEVSETSLRFQRWLNTDYDPYAYAMVEISTNGADWTEIWKNGATTVTDDTWYAQQIDLTAIADHQSTVYFRWGYRIGNGAWAYSGWNIDDIQVWGLGPQVQFGLGDLNCDGSTDVFDIDAFVLAVTDETEFAARHPNCNRSLADCNQDGYADVFDIDAFVSLLAGE